MKPFSALVLAGRRGSSDPLARETGASHRALLEVRGVPMLSRVLAALAESRWVGRTSVSIDAPDLLAGHPELGPRVSDGALGVHRSLDSPSRSVADALGGLAEGERLLVTTADHALLTTEVVDRFAEAADAGGADVAVGVVAASVVRERYPAATRTYLRLRDDAYTGANLFAFRTAGGRRAAEFWAGAERYRKQPWRLAGVFGVGTLLRFALGRLDLDTALERVSEAVGARVAPVRLPFPEAAIDVDRPSDLALAEAILADREKP